MAPEQSEGATKGLRVINYIDPLVVVLKDTPNKGHNGFNLSIKDKFCGLYRTMAVYLLKRTASL